MISAITEQDVVLLFSKMYSRCLEEQKAKKDCMKRVRYIRSCAQNGRLGEKEREVALPACQDVAWKKDSTLSKNLVRVLCEGFLHDETLDEIRWLFLKKTKEFLSKI